MMVMIMMHGFMQFLFSFLQYLFEQEFWDFLTFFLLLSGISCICSYIKATDDTGLGR